MQTNQISFSFSTNKLDLFITNQKEPRVKWKYKTFDVNDSYEYANFSNLSNWFKLFLKNNQKEFNLDISNVLIENMNTNSTTLVRALKNLNIKYENFDNDKIILCFKDDKIIIGNNEFKDFGYNYIYKKIMSTFNLSEKEAKKIIKNYGFIPPEMVKNDFVINEDNGLEITVKNISEVIVNQVNYIFNYLNLEIPKIFSEKIKILVLGEIRNINNLINYLNQEYKNIDWK